MEQLKMPVKIPVGQQRFMAHIIKCSSVPGVNLSQTKTSWWLKAGAARGSAVTDLSDSYQNKHKTELIS